MIRVRVPIVPTRSTAQGKRISARGGKSPRVFKTKQLNQWETVFTLMLKQSAPATPLEGPVKVHVKFVYLAPKSWPKHLRETELEMTGKPDGDNAIKGILDCLTRAGYWVDDVQAWAGSWEQWTGPDPRIEIEITPKDDYLATTQTQTK